MVAVHQLPFGMHKGKAVADVPTPYLKWLIAECKLSSGLAGAVRGELSRRGVTPPAPRPATPHRCQLHPDAEVLAYWLSQRDGRRSIRGECGQCGRWLGALPLSDENRRKADANTDPAALLKFLTTLEDRGITVTRKDDRLTYAPQLTPDLWRIERQCKGLLLSMLIEGNP